MALQLYVDVKVHPTVREFIICTNNGSDTLIPNKGDWLWLLLKQHLCLSDGNYEPITEEEQKNYIKIQLLDAHNSIIYNSTMSDSGKEKRGMHLNILFRNYLSEKGQNIIANHLRKQFKACFHNFMHGAVTAGMQHKDAIDQFCVTYNLSLNEITEDMLKKSWQRSGQKNSFLNKIKSFCPILL